MRRIESLAARLAARLAATAALGLSAGFGLSMPQAIQAGTAFFLGMLVGAWGFGRLADRVGRRRVLVVTVLVDAAFGLASAFSTSPPHGLNGTGWSHFGMIAPYALCGVLLCFLLPSKMNILMLGDETANSLGLRTERFRFFLIAISSLLSGAAISVAGLISFVGLVVPHIARLLVGSDYKYLFPASAFQGLTLEVACDTIGRVIMPPGEIPVSIILSFIGAPFFLYLLRTRETGGEG